MKRESFQGVLLGIVIMCAVFAFITVAWAGLSSTLSISGTATVAAQSWKVGFGSTSSAVVGTDPATVSSSVTPSGTTGLAPATVSLTATAFGSGSTALASFTEPGQKVEYTWYTVNEGTFAAKVTAQQNFLETVNTTTGSNVAITCTSADTTAYPDASAQTFCATYIKALLTIGGTTHTSSSIIADGTAPTLAKPSGSPTYTYTTNVLTLEYLNTIPDTALPKAQVNISLTAPIQITYSQA